MREFKHEYVHIREYFKKDSNNGEYHIKEYNKARNILDIVYCIKDIMHWHEPDLVQMEGVSYGSTGSAALVDLSGLNFSIRMLLIEEDVEFNILAPTAIKKFAVGNGAADKNVMIASWKKLDKNITDITDIKVDDLADSFFIAHYAIN
jgi:Holliday junction resolvasome RuvABC endonuclease subunit